MKDFVSQFGKLKYSYLTSDIESYLIGSSVVPDLVIKRFKEELSTSIDSKDFPHKFNPNTVCKGCNFYLK
jgi:hypothetical protein